MRSTARACEILLWLTVLCPSWSYGAPATTREATGASALFENFESVFYSATELLTSAAPSTLPEKDRRALSAPFAQLSSALKALGGDAEADFMRSSEGILVGAKDFAPPKHLGSVQSRFCYVLILRNHNIPKVGQYFRSAPISVVKEAPVWNWPSKPSEGNPTPSPLYLAQAGQSYIVITNELSELGPMLDDLKSLGESKSALPSVREWQYLSPHSFWGYRR
jgi:hypothetical protein